MPNSQVINDRLWDAVCDADLDALRRLIDAGADIDHVWCGNDDSNLPLLYIVLITKDEQVEVCTMLVNFLIAAGADVNVPIPTRDGQPDVSVLAYATNRGLSDVVATLLEAGADINYLYGPGSSFERFIYSATGMALATGRRGILLDLLRAGAIIPKEYFQWIKDPDTADAATLSLAKRFVRVADDWAGFVRHHRGVLVSILGKCFGDALPHEVLAEVAAHWAPPGGS